MITPFLILSGELVDPRQNSIKVAQNNPPFRLSCLARLLRLFGNFSRKDDRYEGHIGILILSSPVHSDSLVLG